MEPTAPFTGSSVAFDATDDAAEVIGALGLQGFLSGEEPVVVVRSLQRVKPEAPLVPPGIEPARQVFDRRARRLLATGPGWTLVAKVWWDQTAYVSVSAVSKELADDVLAAACDAAERPAETSPTKVEVGFWQAANNGGRRFDRELDVPVWSDIRRNYHAPVAEAVDALVDRTAPEAGSGSGRLMLLHGPPGTGKTTILRALAGAWRSWCKVDAVLDPEHLLARPGYLLEAIADRDQEDDADDGSTPRWRLLVLEDCDELIRAEAKAGTGQALARLLNVTDGMLGQGARVLVCITTNERLGRLHPAITRPGRCLAEVEVGPLTRAEARAWLGRDLLPGEAKTAGDGVTLAELYAARAGDAPVTVDVEPAAIGVYL